MPVVLVRITMSLDGYIAGPNDRPGTGLGEGGERLHDWMFAATPAEADREHRDELEARVGAVIGGRRTYDLAEAWGGSNPFPVPFVILTHHPEDQPESGGFTFAADLQTALPLARAAAGERDVSVMGGADTIRQALRAGVVDELWLSVAPMILGGGKRLFEGFDAPLELEPIRARHSPLATHLGYRVGR